MQLNQEQALQEQDKKQIQWVKVRTVGLQTLFRMINGHSQAFHANIARFGVKQDNVVLQIPSSILILAASSTSWSEAGHRSALVLDMEAQFRNLEGATLQG